MSRSGQLLDSPGIVIGLLRNMVRARYDGLRNVADTLQAQAEFTLASLSDTDLSEACSRVAQEGSEEISGPIMRERTRRRLAR